MYTLEGYQNPFRSRGGNAPTASTGLSMDASAYQTARLAPGISFDSYKRPTAIRSPRGDYVASAPATISASEYLRKKYGDFAGATEIAPPPAKAPSQTAIMGTNALTVGDLKLLQNAIDMELIRLQNIRSVSVFVTIKISQLQVLAENVADVKGRVERGEIETEDVAIFPATARQFLKTFRTSETLPELFDPNGNSPASMAPAPTLAPSTVPSAAPSAPPVSGTSKSPDFLQWLYENIQRLKWSLDADYHVEAAKQREMTHTLNEMETRILGYSYTDTPMPEGYQKMFLNRIRGLQKELNDTPE